MHKSKREFVIPFDALEVIERCLDRRAQEADGYRYSYSFVLSCEKMWDWIRELVELVTKADQDFHRTHTDGVNLEVANRYWNVDRPQILQALRRVVAKYKALVKSYAFVGPELLRDKGGAIEFYRLHRGDLDSNWVDVQLDQLSSARAKHPSEDLLDLMRLLGKDACRCGHIRKLHDRGTSKVPRNCTECKCRIFVGTDDLTHLLPGPT